MMRVMQGNHATYVVLDNIRSAHNVGAIFRTAEGAGVTEVVLSGYTPAPIDRFGRPRADIHKAALGAEQLVPWRSCEFAQASLEYLRWQRIPIVCIEQTQQAEDYRKFTLTGPVAFILGNEREGVDPLFLAAADSILHIPMVGQKESLNVAVAAGIILFHSLRQ